MGERNIFLEVFFLVSPTDKKRFWTAVFYPESMPSDWREKITLLGFPVAFSPLHDKDVEYDGTLKKPHYHVILAFDGPTTYKNVLRICQEFNAPSPKFLQSPKGMYRYFGHLDNPEKYQYNMEEIIRFNGFNIDELVSLTNKEVNDIIRQIQSFIRSEDIREYAVLMDMLLDSGDVQFYDIAQSHTIFFNGYLRSRRHSEPIKKSCDISPIKSDGDMIERGLSDDWFDKKD